MPRPTIAGLQAELQELNEEIGDLKQRLHRAEHWRDKYETKADKAKSRNKKLKQIIAKLELRCATQDGYIQRVVNDDARNDMETHHRTEAETGVLAARVEQDGVTRREASDIHHHENSHIMENRNLSGTVSAYMPNNIEGRPPRIKDPEFVETLSKESSYPYKLITKRNHWYDL